MDLSVTLTNCYASLLSEYQKKLMTLFVRRLNFSVFHILINYLSDNNNNNNNNKLTNIYLPHFNTLVIYNRS